MFQIIRRLLMLCCRQVITKDNKDFAKGSEIQGQHRLRRYPVFPGGTRPAATAAGCESYLCGESETGTLSCLVSILIQLNQSVHSVSLTVGVDDSVVKRIFRCQVNEGATSRQEQSLFPFQSRFCRYAPLRRSR